MRYGVPWDALTNARGGHYARRGQQWATRNARCMPPLPRSVPHRIAPLRSVDRAAPPLPVSFPRAAVPLFPKRLRAPAVGAAVRARQGQLRGGACAPNARANWRAGRPPRTAPGGTLRSRSVLLSRSSLSIPFFAARRVRSRCTFCTESELSTHLSWLEKTEREETEAVELADGKKLEQTFLYPRGDRNTAWDVTSAPCTFLHSRSIVFFFPQDANARLFSISLSNRLITETRIEASLEWAI